MVTFAYTSPLPQGRRAGASAPSCMPGTRAGMRGVPATCRLKAWWYSTWEPGVPVLSNTTTKAAAVDSGMASALVNTMQQVGGSIGTSALSTIALTATNSYLAAHHAGALAPAIAATRDSRGLGQLLAGDNRRCRIGGRPARQPSGRVTHLGQCLRAPISTGSPGHGSTRARLAEPWASHPAGWPRLSAASRHHLGQYRAGLRPARSARPVAGGGRRAPGAGRHRPDHSPGGRPGPGG
jgi:hypothetical protein